MRAVRLGVTTAALACLGAAPPARPDPALHYAVTEGQNQNLFVTDGAVAAHTLLRSGIEPRLLVAFPAGNSGVGLWFERLAAPAAWRVDSGPVAVTLADARGRPVHGVRFAASIATPKLVVRQALLTSVRFLRDYQAVGRFPAEVGVAASVRGSALDWRRDRLDGAAGYRLTVTVTHGRLAGDALLAAADGRIGVEVVAATGEPPLTPLPLADLLNARAAADPAARRALRFLSYREKFLAGSWRFNTYFGRDTLMSLALLMPVLAPPAIEAGLASVLARVRDGDVAHEEGIGEFAVIDNRAHGGAHGFAAADAAALDYKMVDDDFMLAPVAARYLLDVADRAAARHFLAQPVAPDGGRTGAQTNGAMLLGNLRLTVTRARPFAEAPAKAQLIPIKDGFAAGQWRDSNDGLGGGRYAYDVNAALVPATLDAAARLLASGLLEPYASPADRALLARAVAMAAVWHRAAPPLFTVTQAPPAARAAVAAYARTLGVPAAPALAAIGAAPLTFHALSLNADGAPVPIVNSDEGFALLFGAPSPADLDTFVGAVMKPFPAGLMTNVGLLVANPAFAGLAAQAQFGPGAYHGTVIWSWQQALLAAGLERQLARADLPPPTRARLVAAQAQLWRAITATRRFGNSELWSWAYRDGAYHVVAFGAGKADVDESNAAQLWSTVYLAVRSPAGP